MRQNLQTLDTYLAGTNMERRFMIFHKITNCSHPIWFIPTLMCYMYRSHFFFCFYKMHYFALKMYVHNTNIYIVDIHASLFIHLYHIKWHIKCDKH